jgi:hypothetical protein
LGLKQSAVNAKEILPFSYSTGKPAGQKGYGFSMKGDILMAHNFKILYHRNAENLHLKLLGDFDGSSAWELINGLKENCYGINRIFIHTNCLKHVHPFGREVLHKNLFTPIGRSVHVLFTGEKASELDPGSKSGAEPVEGPGGFVRDPTPEKQSVGGLGLGTH